MPARTFCWLGFIANLAGRRRQPNSLPPQSGTGATISKGPVTFSPAIVPSLSNPRDAALARCRELLDGTDPTRLVSLGIVLGQRQLYEAAQAPLAKAERLDPENFEPHYNLGLTYFKVRDYAAARAPLEAAAALRPEHFETAAVLGSTLFALGDDYGALSLLRRAHELRPGDEKVKALLFEQLKIVARHLVAKTEYAAAVPFFEEALQLRPEAPEVHMRSRPGCRRRSAIPQERNERRRWGNRTVAGREHAESVFYAEHRTGGGRCCMVSSSG